MRVGKHNFGMNRRPMYGPIGGASGQVGPPVLFDQNYTDWFPTYTYALDVHDNFGTVSGTWDNAAAWDVTTDDGTVGVVADALAEDGPNVYKSGAAGIETLNCNATEYDDCFVGVSVLVSSAGNSVVYLTGREKTPFDRTGDWYEARISFSTTTDHLDTVIIQRFNAAVGSDIVNSVTAVPLGSFDTSTDFLRLRMNIMTIGAVVHIVIQTSIDGGTSWQDAVYARDASASRITGAGRVGFGVDGNAGATIRFDSVDRGSLTSVVEGDTADWTFINFVNACVARLETSGVDQYGIYTAGGSSLVDIVHNENAAILDAIATIKHREFSTSTSSNCRAMARASSNTSLTANRYQLTVSRPSPYTGTTIGASIDRVIAGAVTSLITDTSIAIVSNNTDPLEYTMECSDVAGDVFLEVRCLTDNVDLVSVTDSSGSKITAAGYAGARTNQSGGSSHTTIEHMKVEEV